MIFTVSEKELSKAFAPFLRLTENYQFTGIGQRVGIATLDDENVIIEIEAAPDVFVQHVFRAYVEKAGYCRVNLPDLCNMLTTSKDEAPSYRFVGGDELVKVEFGIGFFSLTSNGIFQLGDDHKSRFFLRDDWKPLIPKVPEFKASELGEAWNKISTCLQPEPEHDEEVEAYTRRVALRVQDGDVYLQATDGTRLTSHRFCDDTKASDGVFVIGPDPIQILLSGVSEDDDVELMVSGDHVGFQVGGLKVVGPLFPPNRYPSFDRILNADNSDDDVMMMVPSHDLLRATTLAHIVEGTRLKPRCVVQLRELGSGDTRLERTFPQIGDQNIAGTLQVSTRDTAYEIPVVMAKNFKECRFGLNPTLLKEAVETLKSDAVMLRLTPGDYEKAVKIRATNNKRTDIAIMPVYLDEE